MRILAGFLAAVFSGLVAGAAAANDSTAVMEAGGLRLTRDAPVGILSERLYLSVDRVEVDYRFRSASDRDERTLVAFPLPEFDFAWLGPEIMGGRGETVAGRVGFRVQVDGREITPMLELRALRNGVDVTDALTRAGIPLGSLDYDAVTGRLSALDPATRAQLTALDLVEFWGPDEAVPLWTVKATYYWPQVFPAGREVAIRHSYTPIPGAFFVTDPELREIEPEAYCMTEAERAGVRNRIDRSGAGAVLVHDLHYVLSTGANWQGPIGSFHLVVDKGDPSAMVSLCFDGLQKTGPTLFEATRRNFEPDRDLQILFFRSIE